MPSPNVLECHSRTHDLNVSVSPSFEAAWLEASGILKRTDPREDVRSHAIVARPQEQGLRWATGHRRACLKENRSNVHVQGRGHNVNGRVSIQCNQSCETHAQDHKSGFLDSDCHLTTIDS